MTEEKAKRVIVATTVGAVLLLVFLLVLMSYQMISIKVKENRIAYLDSQYQILLELTSKAEETIETRSMKEWIEKEAGKLGLGYKYPV